MPRESDFEKELELEVVHEEDEADRMIAELFQEGAPTKVRDIIPQKKSYNDFDDYSRSDEELGLACPECGNGFLNDVKQTKEGDYITCASCGYSWYAADGTDRRYAQKRSEVVLDKVDTLREEETCVYGMGNDDCGLEDGSCSVCGYEAPPEGLDDPDLTKAKEWDDQEEEKEKRKKEMEERQQRREQHESPSKMNSPTRPSFASYDESEPDNRDAWIRSAPSGVLKSMIALNDGFLANLAKEELIRRGERDERLTSRTSTVQQTQFLYELIGNGFDQMAEKYIQDEIDAGRADQDLMEAYSVLQMQGPEAFRDFVFKNDPLGIDMVENLYGDDSPEDTPDPMDIAERKNRYERNYQDFNRKNPRDPRGPATRDNWDIYRGQR